MLGIPDRYIQAANLRESGASAPVWRNGGILMSTSLVARRRRLPLLALVAALLLAMVPFQMAVAQPVIQVTTLAGDGSAGSLRWAINEVDSGGTITFAPALFTGGPATIQLVGGELVIDDDLTIQGPGRDLLTINGSNNPADPFRVFHITAATAATISGVTISNGLKLGTSNNYPPPIDNIGGGILNYGTLWLRDSAVTGNRVAGDGSDYAFVYGGGIYSSHELHVIDSEISDNLAGSEQPSDPPPNGSVGDGGGIYAWGVVKLDSSTVRNNRAIYGTSAGMTVVGELTVIDSEISGNGTLADANYIGGIFSQEALTMSGSRVTGNTGSIGGLNFSSGAPGDQVTITNSTIAENTGGSAGGMQLTGQATITDVVVSGNTASLGTGGFAFFAIFEGDFLTLTGSEISGNTGEYVGGLGALATNPVDYIEIIDSTISGNTATGDIAFAGGVQLYGISTISGSTISGNKVTGISDATGGLLYESDYDLTITNSTISGNTTPGQAGGILNSHNGTVSISFTTITGNTGTVASGVMNNSSEAIELRATILDGDGSSVDVCSGSINSTLTSLGTDGSCDEDLLYTNPDLGPLQLNAGPGQTETHMLLPGSPALDRIAQADCEVTTDQRGLSRPANGLCDIGAVEVQPLVLMLPANINTTSTSPNGTAVHFVASATSEDGANVPVTCDPETGSTFPLGTTTVNCEATDAYGLTVIGSFTVTVRPAANLAPSLSVPQNTVFYTHNPSGVAVTFVAVASSQIDPNPTVTCSHQSGSVFPIGTTRVTCTATDMWGLSSPTGNFLIIVVLGDPPSNGGGDPTDPGEPTDPTDPTDPGEPTDPTDPTDPGEPGVVDTSAFDDLWTRTDKLVADGDVQRSWIWGPAPFTSLQQTDNDLVEEYGDGERVVRYYDKARMEINDPDGDTSSIWFVTTGLLVVELITGQMQVGDDSFVERGAAEIAVAGDLDDPSSPTYASLAGLLGGVEASDATITARLALDGSVSDDPAMAERGVGYVYYDEITSHNIAEPFWAFMNSTGLVYESDELVEGDIFLDPFFAVGRPITEAYWVTVPVAGTSHDVLLQCFERRCLTYTPENDPDWQVEAGNVGLHYFWWRYQE